MCSRLPSCRREGTPFGRQRTCPMSRVRRPDCLLEQWWTAWRWQPVAAVPGVRSGTRRQRRTIVPAQRLVAALLVTPEHRPARLSVAPVLGVIRPRPKVWPAFALARSGRSQGLTACLSQGLARMAVPRARKPSGRWLVPRRPPARPGRARPSPSFPVPWAQAEACRLSVPPDDRKEPLFLPAAPCPAALPPLPLFLRWPALFLTTGSSG